MFRNIARKQRTMLGTSLLAPIVPNTPNQKIVTRIDGVVWEFAVSAGISHEQAELAVFTIQDENTVVYKNRASLQQTVDYFQALPMSRMFYLHDFGGVAFIGFSGHDSFQRLERVPHSLNFFLPPPLHVRRNVMVLAAFDGTQFWYVNADPILGHRWLMSVDQLLAEEEPPESLYGRRFPQQAKLVYDYLAAWKIEEKRLSEASKKLTRAEVVQQTLQAVGARFYKMEERGDTFVLQYEVDGRHYTSILQQDLSVVRAGICLNGTDHTLNLPSLVSVLRLGHERRQINRV